MREVQATKMAQVPLNGNDSITLKAAEVSFTLVSFLIQLVKVANRH